MRNSVLTLGLLASAMAGCNGETTPTDTPTPTGSVTPTDCEAQYQYDDWNVEADRRLVAACSPYVIDADLEITSGATLTIDAGVEVQVSRSHWVDIDDGILVAEGTTDDPIVFTSSEASPGPGSWLGLRFREGTSSGTVLRNVIVQFAGEDAYSQHACIDVQGDVNAVVLDQVTFESCGQGGLYVDTPGFVDASGLVFRGDDGFGLSTVADAIGSIDEAFVYDGILRNRIHEGSVTGSATWLAQPVPWYVDGDLAVSDPSSPMLTLTAGTHLLFEPSSWIQVGQTEPGGLITQGTTADPVVFGSSLASPTAGSWLGLSIEESILNGTTLAGLQVMHAGEDAYSKKGCVTIDGDTQGRVTIQDSTFESCGQAGVTATDEAFTFAAFTGNTFVDAPYGWNLRPRAVAAVDGTQTYTDTPANRITGGTLDQSAVWTGQGIPTDVFDSIEVEGDADPVLTLSPGVHLRFESDEWFDVGSSANGGLISAGEDGNPVLLESSAPTPAAGDWLGLRLGDQILAGTSLAWTEVRHGGQDAYSMHGCVHVNGDHTARVAITDSTFTSCAQSGVYAGGESFTFAGFTGNTFESNAYGLWSRPTALGSVATAQTYTDTASNRVTGGDVTTSQTWVDQGVPYDVFGSIDVDGSADPVLTLSAGVHLRFESDQWLQIGSGDDGGLVVEGTATDRVVFESQQATPTAGSWLGLNFSDYTLAGTLVDYAHVAHAGQDAYGQDGGITLRSTGTNVTISNTTFADNLQTDVACDAGSTPTLTNLGAASTTCL